MEVGNPQGLKEKEAVLESFQMLKVVQTSFIFEFEYRYAALLRGMQRELIVASQCSRVPNQTQSESLLLRVRSGKWGSVQNGFWSVPNLILCVLGHEFSWDV